RRSPPGPVAHAPTAVPAPGAAAWVLTLGAARAAASGRGGVLPAWFGVRPFDRSSSLAGPGVFSSIAGSGASSSLAGPGVADRHSITVDPCVIGVMSAQNPGNATVEAGTPQVGAGGRRWVSRQGAGRGTTRRGTAVADSVTDHA